MNEEDLQKTYPGDWMNFKEIKREIEDGITIETVTIDIRPSRWRHPILRLNWWWMDKREARRRKKLSPLERDVEDSLRRGLEHTILFGEDEVIVGIDPGRPDNRM